MTIDDRMLERLSRFLDGDLDPDSAKELSARLEIDLMLQTELAALREVRRSLSSLAEREDPPAELDALIEPLLRGKPTPLIARPWAKFMAAAAVVVLGATVVFEINRRELGPRSELRLAKQEKSRPEILEEAPSVVVDPPQVTPETERPRGALDRLLASPDPEVEGLDEDSPALEVIGPLHDGEFEARGARSRSDEAADSKGAAPVVVGEALGSPAPKQPSAKKTSDDPRPEGNAFVRPTARAKLYIFMEDETAWQDFDPGIQSESGRYALRVRVSDGAVREVWPVGRPPAAPSQHLRAGEVILGLKITGVPDGEYAAEVMVEPYSPQRQ